MDDKQRIALVETRTQGSDGSPPHFSVTSRQPSRLGDPGAGRHGADHLLRGVLSVRQHFLSEAGRSAAEVSLKRYRYTGMERDEETGFNYHMARYYASWLGRWSSADPRDISDGVNTYVYAQNRPVTLVDPAGTDSKLSEVGACRANDTSPLDIAPRPLAEGPINTPLGPKYLDPDRPVSASVSMGPLGNRPYSTASSVYAEFQMKMAGVDQINLPTVGFVLALEITGHDSRPFLTKTAPLANILIASGDMYGNAARQPNLSPSGPSVLTPFEITGVLGCGPRGSGRVLGCGVRARSGCRRGLNWELRAGRGPSERGRGPATCGGNVDPLQPEQGRG